MKAILDWLDHRTGYRHLMNVALYENIPGGARWRYVWGSTLMFAFATQIITGTILWMAYSPSAQTAWESVYYIEHRMAGGSLLRGIHHYTSQIMILLLALHLMQVVIDGAYRAPREVNFWLGLILLQVVLGLSLTGYLLPWDQKGYWATKVATNIMAIVPVAGPDLQRLVVGGEDYGHHTLTRFFALHAGILPGTLILMIVGHLYVFRRHGVTARKPIKKPDQTFWPEQALRDGVAGLAVLAMSLGLVLWMGADLGAPADGSEPYAAARPEWYFLFLFQLLKYFPGKTEIIGAIILPSLVMGFMFMMPFIGKWKLGHRFNVIFVFCLLGAAGGLTALAILDDRRNPDHQRAVEMANRDRDRVILLASGPNGIPPEGAVTLLRNDPYTQGPKLFARHCASCHRYEGHDGTGAPPKEEQTASDLKGYASRAWISGLLNPEKVDSLNYFGGGKHKTGDMVKFVKEDVSAFDDTEKAMLEKVIKAVSAEAALESQTGDDKADESEIVEGRTLLGDEGLACMDCHSFRGQGKKGKGPDLTGYGSRLWLSDFISDPAHERFYGEKNDRMPRFGAEGTLNEKQIGLLADWLRGEWYKAPNPVSRAP